MSILPERPQLLKPGEGANVDATLRVLELIQTQELHFNKLCADFKKMASTWLLATFGGIGFLLSTEIDIGLDRYVLIGGVAAAGAVGIYLLWVVDLLVYQRLLSSAFTWRGQIEEENPWLPAIFETMSRRIFGRNVGFNLAWFYLLGVLVPALISLASLAWALCGVLGRTGVSLGALAVLLALFVVLRRMFHNSTPQEARMTG